MEGDYQDDDVAEEYGEEYVEEEEETRQPTQEEVEYLELRQRLKDSMRRKRKQSALTSSQEKFPYKQLWILFWPFSACYFSESYPRKQVIIGKPEFGIKMLSSNQSSKQNPASNSAGPKQAQHCQALKPPSELRRKVEKLKVARDYSFLSDDTGVPATAKDPPPRNVSAPTSEARSAQMLLKSREPLNSNNNSGRNLQGTREERKSVPLKG